MNFAILVDHRMKIKENKKIGKYLDLARELKMQSDMSDGDPIYPTPLLGQDMTQGQFLSGV